MVNFAYGRRGSTMNTGTKTQAPVSLDQALKIYTKLVGEKTAKGYTPGPDGTPYSGTEQAGEVSGLVPQLCNEIAETELERYFVSDIWCAQEKFDGRRIMVRSEGAVEAINRKGLIVGAPAEVLAQVAGVSGLFTLDGEMMGDIYHAFDHLTLGEPERMLYERLITLDQIRWQSLPNVQIVETAYTEQQKRDLYAELRKRNAEGIVFKNLNSPYAPGRPASGGNWLKFKFYKTLTAVVNWINDDRRSVSLQLFEDGTWYECGNVTIPSNRPIPEMFQTVEIRYLYATSGKILYQPVYLGVRDDINPLQCLRSQLKFAGTENDAE